MIDVRLDWTVHEDDTYLCRNIRLFQFAPRKHEIYTCALRGCTNRDTMTGLHGVFSPGQFIVEWTDESNKVRFAHAIRCFASVAPKTYRTLLRALDYRTDIKAKLVLEAML
jgi:hypothetical protein